MAAPVCKYARLVTRADNLGHEVENAIGAAIHGRPGPVHLTIPVDVWSQPAGGGSSGREAPARGGAAAGRGRSGAAADGGGVAGGSEAAFPRSGQRRLL